MNLTKPQVRDLLDFILNQIDYDLWKEYFIWDEDEEVERLIDLILNYMEGIEDD